MPGTSPGMTREIMAYDRQAPLQPHCFGHRRLAAALEQRYGRLDVLIGNAAVVADTSPLGHIEPKSWERVMAVNVTANWHLIRYLDPLLQKSDAGRAVFITSGAASSAKAYRG